MSNNYNFFTSKKVYLLYNYIKKNQGVSLYDLSKVFKKSKNVISEQLKSLKDIDFIVEQKKGKFKYFYLKTKKEGNDEM